MQLSLFESVVLNSIERNGSTRAAYSDVAALMGLGESEFRAEKVDLGKWGLRSKWEHRVRSIQSRLRSRGLIERGNRTGEWVVTQKGRSDKSLSQHAGGEMKVGFVTKKGMAFFGPGEGLADLFPEECSLVFCSPPYFTARPYGHGGGTIAAAEQEYVDQIVRMVSHWVGLLAPGGSFVLNLGAHTIAGSHGEQSMSTEMIMLSLRQDLGLRLVQRSVWRNPARPPTGAFTTGVKGAPKCRLKNQVEDVLWFSLDIEKTNQKVRTSRVLVPYSSSYKSEIERKQKRKSSGQMVFDTRTPSGQSKAASTYAEDLGGSIPPNYFEITHESAYSDYSKNVKAAGLPRHPAMCPRELVDFWIRLCTEEGDLVADPCFGSGVTGASAEALNRYWVGADITLEYLQGASLRFH